MKTQLNMIFFLFFSFFIGQGFHYHITKTLKSQEIHIKVKSHTSLTLRLVHVKYRSNKWSLSNPTHELKIGISNDMQCSNKLNTSMTCNPLL